MSDDAENKANDYLLSAVKQLRLAGEGRQALAIAKKVLRKNSDSLELIFEIGNIYNALADFENAEKWYKKALAIAPKHLAVLQAIGLSCLSRKNFSDAVDYLIHYLKLKKWKNEYSTLSNLSTILSDVQGEDREKIIQTLQDAWVATLDPKVGYLCANIIRSYGKLDEALAIMKLLVSHDPSAENYNLCGVIQEQSGENADASEMFLKAVRIIKTEWGEYLELWDYSENDMDQTLAVYRSNLSGAYLALGKYTEALVEAEEALKLNPFGSYHWLAKINALQELKRYSDVAAVYRAALQSDLQSEFLLETEREQFLLGHAVALYRIALDYKNQFFKIEKLDSSSNDPLSIATGLFFNRKRREAIQTVEQALAEEINTPGLLTTEQKKDLIVFKEEFWKLNQLFEAALVVFLEGAQKYKHTARFSFEAAHIYSLMGQYDRAVLVFETGLKQYESEEYITAFPYEFNSYINYLHLNHETTKAREKISQYAGNFFEPKELKRTIDAFASDFSYITLDDDQPVVEAIEQFYEIFPDRIEILEMYYHLRLYQGRQDECIFLLNRMLQFPLMENYLITTLNNLGYLFLLKKEPSQAKLTLERAQSIEMENEADSDHPGLHSVGILFYLDGKISPCDWIGSVSITYLESGFWNLKNPQIGVRCNLATLALLENHIEEASALVTGLLLEKNVGQNEQQILDILQISLAVSRNELKTARLLWKHYLAIKSDAASVELFRQKHSELYARLNQAA